MFMCGIAGIFGLSDRNLIGRMAEKIAHRGPDSVGFFIDKEISLGMRRLSIIDLRTGDQPVYDDEKGLVIVFNGEIYNYQELREDLKKKGHKFHTSGDTEVILHAYKEYGAAGLGKLNGMFAVAIYDIKKNELILARDRAGIKPLYYAFAGGKLIFGSEIKCILEYKEFKPQVDNDALSSYLTYGTVFGGFTLFKGVNKLLPGKILSFNGKEAKLSDFEKKWDSGTGSHSPDALLTLMEKVVKSQMVSDVPLGAFLSGGIDSSTIVGIMSNAVERPVETFTVGFGEKSDEVAYARAVSEHFGTNHHELIVFPEEVPQIVNKLVWHYDDLTWDSASLPVYMVSELARKHVKVVLTGEGSDELFAGYERYKPFSPAIPFVPASMRWSAYRRFITMFDSGTRRKLASISSSYAEKVLDGYEKRRGSPLQNVLDFEFNEFLPHQLLNKADKATMAASLEGRVPYLDNDMIAFAAKVPLEMKLHGLEGKHILRKSVAGLLPDITRKRMKKGFGAKPIFWFRDKGMMDFTRNMLDDARMKAIGIDCSYCDEIIRNLEKPKKAYQLWALLLLELWYRKFIEAEK